MSKRNTSPTAGKELSDEQKEQLIKEIERGYPKVKLNNDLVDSIISRFVQQPGDIRLYDHPGSFRLYKMLNDLLTDYIATGIMEGMDKDYCNQWLTDFSLIADTLFNLETLAAEANNIKAAAVRPAG